MHKKLIINADDFGLDNDVNIAIIELASKKAITSTTIMANLQFSGFLDKLKETYIGIGLHLNLIEGKPLSAINDVFSLVDEHGNFKNLYQLLAGFMSGKIKKLHLEKEISAQIGLLNYYGIQLTHADSHKHIHQLPGLGPFICKVLNKKGVKKIRNCSPTSINSVQMLSVKAFSAVTKNQLSGFNFPEKMFSFFSTHTNGNYSNFISSLKAAFCKYNSIEIMTHPGLENKNGSYLNRKAEYYFLNKLPDLLASDLPDVQLINYKQL